MNAGGHGSDMAASLVGVRVVDLRTGEDGVVPASRARPRLPPLGRRRRTSSWWRPTSPSRAGDAEHGRGRRWPEIVAWRRANQPGGPNAGSVFTNPQGDSAGRLIDAAGPRASGVGTAAVSTKHANFIQADEGGRADDVRALMRRRRSIGSATVTGVELHPETRLVGFDHNPRPEVEG